MLAQYLNYRKISLKIVEEKVGEGRWEEKKKKRRRQEGKTKEGIFCGQRAYF